MNTRRNPEIRDILDSATSPEDMKEVGRRMKKNEEETGKQVRKHIERRDATPILAELHDETAAVRKQLEGGDLSTAEAADQLFTIMNTGSRKLKKATGRKERGWHPLIKGDDETKPSETYTFWRDLKDRVKAEEEIEKSDDQNEEAPEEKNETPQPSKKTRIVKEQKAQQVLGGSTPMMTTRTERLKRTKTEGLSYEATSESERLHAELMVDYPKIRINPDGSIPKGFFSRNKRKFERQYDKDAAFKERVDVLRRAVGQEEKEVEETFFQKGEDMQTDRESPTKKTTKKAA